MLAAASSDLDEDQRLHRSRHFRLRPRDGMMDVEGRLTMDAGARLKAFVDARTDIFFAQARSAGRPERREAYAADALMALIDASTPGPKAVVNVMVDYAAIKRGRLENGERCAIPGIGPISIPAARRFIEQGVVNAVLTQDADVRAVSNLGRVVPANLRRPLEARDPVCVVPGCSETEDLEVHRLTDPLAETRRARLSDLCRLCHPHKLLVTYRGYRIAGRPGEWAWLPPEHAGLSPPEG